MDLQTQTQRIISLYFIKKHAYIYVCSLFLLIATILIAISSIVKPFDLQYSVYQHKQQSCDYSNGQWVWDENYPFHSYNETCKFLDPGFRCRENGRTNQSFRHWRWKPHGCDFPRYLFFINLFLLNLVQIYVFWECVYTSQIQCK